uniref:Carbonic anhydrase n=1 Tax=Globodera pallida TaxID=36090 RepID=A0A183CAA1_GLOPA
MYAIRSYYGSIPAIELNTNYPNAGCVISDQTGNIGTEQNTGSCIAISKGSQKDARIELLVDLTNMVNEVVFISPRVCWLHQQDCDILEQKVLASDTVIETFTEVKKILNGAIDHLKERPSAKKDYSKSEWAIGDFEKDLIAAIGSAAGNQVTLTASIGGRNISLGNFLSK